MMLCTVDVEMFANCFWLPYRASHGTLMTLDPYLGIAIDWKDANPSPSNQYLSLCPSGPHKIGWNIQAVQLKCTSILWGRPVLLSVESLQSMFCNTQTDFHPWSSVNHVSRASSALTVEKCRKGVGRSACIIIRAHILPAPPRRDGRSKRFTKMWAALNEPQPPTAVSPHNSILHTSALTTENKGILRFQWHGFIWASSFEPNVDMTQSRDSWIWKVKLWMIDLHVNDLLQ